MFPDVEIVRSMQAELDEVIKIGVERIVQLLKNTDSSTTRIFELNEEELKGTKGLMKKNLNRQEKKKIQSKSTFKQWDPNGRNRR